MYLLDTDISSYLMKRRHPALLERVVRDLRLESWADPERSHNAS